MTQFLCFYKSFHKVQKKSQSKNNNYTNYNYTNSDYIIISHGSSNVINSIDMTSNSIEYTRNTEHKKPKIQFFKKAGQKMPADIILH